MKKEIPIYRAKKKDSDEYIIGYPINKTHMFVPDSFDVERSGTIGNGFEPYYFETLSINFEDMIDSEGTKIFASLSENGKGGDIFTHKNFTSSHYKIKFVNGEIGLNIIPIDGDMTKFTAPLSYAKVTGIQD